jgi:DNA-binding response OmpR family regulator
VLKGFASGADDYLPKPFDLAILLARVNGLLRRSDWASRQKETTTPPGPEVFNFHGRTLDFSTLELTSPAGKTQLTLMEASLLRYFLEHPNRNVSRKQILEEVWGLHEDTDTRAIDNFIVRLRRYIEDSPGTPALLVTVRGVGYRFLGE